jgi:surface protein
MFENCISLEKIPDISKWNITNVKNISNIFLNCSSLISIPNISKWDFSNVENKDKIISESNLSINPYSMASDSPGSNLHKIICSSSIDPHPIANNSSEGNFQQTVIYKDNVNYDYVFNQETNESKENYYDNFYN